MANLELISLEESRIFSSLVLKNSGHFLKLAVCFLDTEQVFHQEFLGVLCEVRTGTLYATRRETTVAARVTKSLAIVALCRILVSIGFNYKIG